jgi:serine/threonine protein phosphatase PrpC
VSFALRSGSATDTGRVRPTNQDCVLEEDGLYAVADGMGGHAAGEIAAQIAVDVLRAKRSEAPQQLPPNFLAQSIMAANRAIWSKAGSDRRLRGMGTTLVGLARVHDSGHERIVIANVGDSRAYLFDGERLLKLTTDHTVAQAKLDAKEITAQEAQTHPHRHILTRALGTEPNIEIDAFSRDPVPGNRYLLCSDGLFNEASDEEIAEILRRNPDPKRAALALIEVARAHGGSDNISVVVVDVVGTDSPAPATSRTEDRPQPREADASDNEATMTPKQELPGFAAGLRGGAFGAAMAGLAKAPNGGGVSGPSGPPASAAAERAEPAGGGARQGAGHSSTAPDYDQQEVGEVDPAAGEADHLAPTRGGPSGQDEATPEVETGPTDRSPADRPLKSPLKSEGPGQASDQPASPSAMSEVMADVLRAADTPEWQLTPAARALRRRTGPVGPVVLDHLFAASERSGALRQADEREGLRAVIRHSERQERSRRFPHIVRAGATAATSATDLPAVPTKARVTWRVALFALALAAIVGGSFGSIVWFQENSYYVGLDGRELAIYHGRPGGMAWFSPHRIVSTGVSVSQILPDRLADVRAGVVEPSEKAAESYVRNLVAEKNFALDQGQRRSGGG